MLREWKSIGKSWIERLNIVSFWRRILSGLGSRSLVSRLLALQMLGAIIIYLIVNIGLWWTSSRLIEDNLEKQAVRWLAELDELGTPLYASQGGKQLANIDKRIKHFPEIGISSAAVIRADLVPGCIEVVYLFSSNVPATPGTVLFTL